VQIITLSLSLLFPLRTRLLLFHPTRGFLFFLFLFSFFFFLFLSLRYMDAYDREFALITREQTVPWKIKIVIYLGKTGALLYTYKKRYCIFLRAPH
jgi:hypothetical protein